ncbi:MAG: hypothetical protein ACI9JK_001145 [Phycisphaerales bacterium]|jgi:hypothetical protein
MFPTLCISVLAMLAPERAASYSQAMDVAKRTNRSVLVFAHGSDWCVHGERMKENVWDTFEGANQIIFVDVDVLESEHEVNTARNEGFDIKQVTTYPSILAFDSDGIRLGVRAGATLPKGTSEANKVLESFARSVSQRMTLQMFAASAKASGDMAKETHVLHLMLAQDLSILESDLVRLKEIDPEDPTGKRRRAEFQPFHPFVARATKDGQEGRGEQAITRLQTMLDEGVYTSEQQAWIHNAMGSVYRYWEGHDIEAEKQFLQAASVAPSSVPGIAGARLAEKLYPKSRTQ